jgi:hypothetical protein
VHGVAIELNNETARAKAMVVIRIFDLLPDTIDRYRARLARLVTPLRIGWKRTH